MVVQKAIFLLFFVSKVNISLGNPFPQDFETDDNLDNPILLDVKEDLLDPGQCILPAELQYDGNIYRDEFELSWSHSLS